MIHGEHFPKLKLQIRKPVAFCGLSRRYRRMASDKECQSHCTPRAFGWQEPGPLSGPARERLPVGVVHELPARPRPCCISHAGSGNDDGVAPQPAARAVGVGAVVGCGDVQLARDAVG
jgi:hypothetical protein